MNKMNLVVLKIKRRVLSVFFLIILTSEVLLLALTGCNKTKRGESNNATASPTSTSIPMTCVSDEIVHTRKGYYPCMNSTDIFEIGKDGKRVYQCCLDGTRKKYTGIEMPDKKYIIYYVDDSWMYYYYQRQYNHYVGEDFFEFAFEIWRIPLGKGEDNRTVVLGRPEKIRDDFGECSRPAIVGDYIAYIEPSDYLLDYTDIEFQLFSTKDGKKDSAAIEVEMTDEEWMYAGYSFPCAQGADWVLWQTMDHIYLQKIPSNEIVTVANEINLTTQEKWCDSATASEGKDIVYYTPYEVNFSIKQYDVRTDKTSEFIRGTEIVEAICKELSITEDDIDEYSLVDIIEKNNKLYVVISLSFQDEGSRDVILSKDLTNGGRVLWETKFNNALQHMKNRKITVDSSCELLGYVSGKWFFVDYSCNDVWCYDEVTEEIKELRENDKEVAGDDNMCERNICNALWCYGTDLWIENEWCDCPWCRQI